MRDGKFVVGIDFDGTLARTIGYRLDQLFPNKSTPPLIIENMLFFTIDLFRLGQHSSKKVLNEVNGDALDRGLKELIQRLTLSGKFEFVVVTANAEVDLIKEYLGKNGLDIEVLRSKKGGKNGFKFIDLVVDDSFSELKKNVFWEAEHNFVLGKVFRGVGLRVASNSNELESIINKEAASLLSGVKRDANKAEIGEGSVAKTKVKA